MVQAQDRNRVNMNNEISDNLDLRAVADIFWRFKKSLKKQTKRRTTDIKFRFKQ
jgi:hypothetical protein